MNWFRVDVSMIRHAKVALLADRLSIPKVVAVGHLIALFAYYAELHEDGNLSHGTWTGLSRDIETNCMWDASRPGELAAALIDVGWVKDGALVGWSERHNSMLSERNRKRAYRKRRTGQTRDRDGTVPEMSRGTSAGPSSPTLPYLDHHQLQLQKMPSTTPCSAVPQSTDSPKQRKRPAATVGVQAVLDDWHDAYLADTGHKPDIRGKHAALAKAALRSYPVEELRDLRADYVAGNRSGAFGCSALTLDEFLSSACLGRLRADRLRRGAAPLAADPIEAKRRERLARISAAVVAATRDHPRAKLLGSDTAEDLSVDLSGGVSTWDRTRPNRAGVDRMPEFVARAEAENVPDANLEAWARSLVVPVVAPVAPFAEAAVR